MPKISSEKMELRKQEILKYAFEVFSTKGYTQASMDDIVKHSGISKGGLYTHFKSKEEIFLAIAEQRFQLRSDFLHSLDTDKSAVVKLTQYLRWFLDSLQNESICMGIRFTIEFWSILSKDSSKSGIARTRYDKFERDLEGLLLDGIKKGEFRKDLDTKSAVYMILSSMDGIGFIDAVMGIKITEAAVNEYVIMILSHLTGK